jgi:hypothetical protein
MAQTLQACRESFRPIFGKVREVGLVRFRPVQRLYGFALAAAVGR